MQESVLQRTPQNRVARVRLDDNTTMLIQLAEQVQPQEAPVAPQTYNFDTVASTVRSLSTKLVDSVKAASPTKFSVELGFDFTVESGSLTTLLVKGEGSASVKVTLEWDQSAKPGG